MPKRKSIQPLDGGASAYMEVLEEIRSFVDSKSTLTKYDLKFWYSKQYGKGVAPDEHRDQYIQSLFRSGLLRQARGRIKCTFPRGQNRDRKVIEIIDDHILYFLDMLNDARDGAKLEHLNEFGKRKHKLGVSQTRRRMDWLEAAKALELRDDRKLYATRLGQKILDDHPNFGPQVARRSVSTEEESPAEFGGKGEGPNHKTLKEYVHKMAEKVCGAKVKERQMEYPLPSGDKVDVTALDKGTIWHIEVKSRTSQDPDVKRGIYQCVKYAAVGKAVEKAENSGRRVKSLLVVESKPSENVSALAKKLDVRVYRLPASMRRELNELRAASG